MKRLVRFGAVIALLSLSSCAKDWECECALYNANHQVIEFPEVSPKTYSYENLSRSQAESKCDVQQATSNPGEGNTYECELK